MKNTQIILISLISIFVLSCNFSKQKETADSRNDMELSAALKSSEIPGFQFIRDQILTRNNSCNQCHRWADNYEGVKLYVIPGNSLGSPLLKKLKNLGGSMPKDGQALNPKAVQVLKAWIDAGANELPKRKDQIDTEPVVYPDRPVFADVKKYVFSTNCFSCHRSDSDDKDAREYPLQNYADILKYTTTEGLPVLVPGSLADSVMWEDVNKKLMPPKEDIVDGNATALTDDQIQLIKRWIEQGAINEPNSPPAVPTPSTVVPQPPVTTPTTAPVTNISFAEVSTKVFEVNCTTCHSTTSQNKANKIPLSTYRQIMDFKSPKFKLIVPGDLAKSKIWDNISTKDMPPKKAIDRGTVPAMTEDQIELVKQWILTGANE